VRLRLAPVWELVVPSAHQVASISVGRELPVELALLVVAVVANISAIRRMFRIAELIRAKKLAALKMPLAAGGRLGYHHSKSGRPHLVRYLHAFWTLPSVGCKMGKNLVFEHDR
jgi:hypothetical protein